VGLCDREPERVAKFANDPFFKDKFSPKDSYDSLEAVLKAKFDGVVIITQPWLHAEQAVKAMESGKHVYSAVPIVSLPDGDEILEWCSKVVDTSRRTGMRYMLGETTYYRPQTMFCRRMAAQGKFGYFVHADAQYFHDVDSPTCNLRDVHKSRAASKAGQEWETLSKRYTQRGVKSGPMHYPTHSVSGPLAVMKTHAVKVCCWGYRDPDNDPYHGGGFSDETALFHLANGATMRICEYRQIGQSEEEMFRLFGSKATFREERWCEDKHHWRDLAVEQMRDPLPAEVHKAFEGCSLKADLFGEFGGHGGSHPYLVHEFVSAVAENRQPSVNAWEAARYMACGVMAHKSALKEGAVLEVPDWGEAP
jgi:predicted dehydrogenase